MLFPAVRHEVWFWHGADRLAGDLALPAGPGPHPVLLVVGDPLRGGRDRSYWRDAFAAAGVATFSWDRSGGGPVGEPASGPAGVAREVLAAVRKLHCLPDVDRSALAVIGFGAGGWAAAQAATFDGGIRALILAGTPMVAPARPGDVDPRPTLSAVTVPVLALFGEHDPLTPLEESIRGVRSALRAGDHLDHEVAVVRGGDHGLRVRPGHGLGGMVGGRHRFGDWPPGLAEHLLNWLDGRLRPAAVVPAFVPPAEVTADLSDPVPADPPTSPTSSALPGVPTPPLPVQQPHLARHPSGRAQLSIRQVRRRVNR